MGIKNRMLWSFNILKNLKEIKKFNEVDNVKIFGVKAQDAREKGNYNRSQEYLNSENTWSCPARNIEYPEIMIKVTWTK